MSGKAKRLLGTVAGAMILAAVTGFGVARCTADPAAAPAAEGEKEAASEALPSSLAIAPDAIKAAEIGVETIGAGGLGSEIISQATVTAAPSGEAIVTARAGGAVTRLFKRLGDPVSAGETIAIVQSRDAAQIAAERIAAEQPHCCGGCARRRRHQTLRGRPRQDVARRERDGARAPGHSGCG